MNAVEIEEAVSALTEQPFNAAEFPFAFLMAFGNKETTIRKLRSGTSNKSDLGGVLQTNNIHIAVAPKGEVTSTLKALRASPATGRAKAKFILSTDGDTLEAEDLVSGDTIACAYQDFPGHFGFLLPLAGITTVKQIRESSFDIRATGRLNRLYVQLLSDNPDWGAAARRPEMNHFMARLIFCFFAEDTDIFHGERRFTTAVEQMSAKDSTNTHEVIGIIFRAMNTRNADRATAKIPRWADIFPYVNGGLFSGSTEVPKFSKIARTYLIHIGNLDWKQINPDIFGSMIQAVADDEERGALGMHYTSVPNILKVLNPLFLDDLREKLEEAGDNSRKLLNLRSRMARIRVFDPACGSGNFLVIAYKEMRAIEAEINARRGEVGRRTDIPLTNYRGIELRDFPAEIARLALIIAEYQCDVLYRGQKEALKEFLPLDAENWITCGNALRLDWLSICPPTGTAVKHTAEDLFHTHLNQAQVDFENEGGETYICGNPPYVWGNEMSNDQKSDLKAVVAGATNAFGSLDYVAGWFLKARDYFNITIGKAAFVTTNSINQGRQVGILWPIILKDGFDIVFGCRSLKWSNLAANNAGVTVNIVGFGRVETKDRLLFVDGVKQVVSKIGPYLIPAATAIVEKSSRPISNIDEMKFGNMPIDGGNMLLSFSEAQEIVRADKLAAKYIRPVSGSQEMIYGLPRFCIWIGDSELEEALKVAPIKERIERVAISRGKSKRAETKKLANVPHRFGFVSQLGEESIIAIPAISSEGREFLPVQLYPKGFIITNRNYGIFNGEIWNVSILASRMHMAWITTVCGTLELRISYTNTLGWNTFPVPALTEKNKSDLTRCAEEILLAREAHYPATIADLYDPDTMPSDLRQAHERNDEILERIYIGRRFRNDTERLEKLFELYTKMTSTSGSNTKSRKAKAAA